mmetsp:Transcript_110151/g.351007  ORF Transcript_110151/g.351007 Transcript_110151/m.351007 type:complete len:296 (+) Transcript_110151:1940-2827(+)
MGLLLEHVRVELVQLHSEHSSPTVLGLQSHACLLDCHAFNPDAEALAQGCDHLHLATLANDCLHPRAVCQLPPDQSVGHLVLVGITMQPTPVLGSIVHHTFDLDIRAVDAYNGESAPSVVGRVEHLVATGIRARCVCGDHEQSGARVPHHRRALAVRLVPGEETSNARLGQELADPRRPLDRVPVDERIVIDHGLALQGRRAVLDQSGTAADELPRLADLEHGRLLKVPKLAVLPCVQLCDPLLNRLATCVASRDIPCGLVRETTMEEERVIECHGNLAKTQELQHPRVVMGWIH